MPRNYTLKQPRSRKQLEGLQPNIADDTEGDTVPITGKISPSEKVALDALPGSRSQKIRQAIREFLERRANEG